MTDGEKALVKKFAHEFLEQDLPQIIAVEEEHLPEMYKGLVKMCAAAILPKLIASLEAKIDAALA